MKSDKIKVVHITPLSKEEILEKPSNYSYYIKDMLQDNRFEVILVNPNQYSKYNRFKGSLMLIKDIRKISPHILYISFLLGLNFLVVCRALRIIKCKIFIWKYTFCKTGNNSIHKFLLKHIYWKNISRIYMAYPKHTEHAIEYKIVKKDQIVTLSRGVEYRWYQQFIAPQKKGGAITVIATGKDNRDYDTLCKACELSNTNCIIYTRKHPNCINSSLKFKDSKYCKFFFMEDIKTDDEYNFIMKQVGKANVLAICCTNCSYGVGYTNLIEGLPFKIPILITDNPYALINVEKEEIGYNIALSDINDWVNKLNVLKNNPSICLQMGENIDKLLQKDWNSVTTFNFIANDILNHVKNIK